MGKKKGRGKKKRTASDAKPVAPAADAGVRETSALESTLRGLSVAPATLSPEESTGSPPQGEQEIMQPLKLIMKEDLKGGGGIKRTATDAKPVAPVEEIEGKYTSVLMGVRIPPATQSLLESPGVPSQWDKESMEPLKVVVEEGSK